MQNTVNFLACPYCISPLQSDMRCNSCNTTFPVKNSQPDLRIQRPVTVDVKYNYTPEFGSFPWEKASLNWPVMNDLTKKAGWDNVEANMLISVPKAEGHKLSLDIGCGHNRQRFQEGLRMLGYSTFGIDIDGNAPDALADAHFLPFADNTFDLIMSSAVFEHLKNPFLAMKELHRVAKPGAKIVLCIAYNEPFHISYFHHSPLAVHELMVSMGITPHQFILSWEWNSFNSNLHMGFAGSRMPAFMQKIFEKSVKTYALFPARIKGLLKGDRKKVDAAKFSFARSHSGVVSVIATKD